MARIDNDMATLVVESAPSLNIEDGVSKNSMVLPCGRIFIPSRRSPCQHDEIYKILKDENKKGPKKIVSGSIPKNLLQEVLHKESMN